MKKLFSHIKNPKIVRVLIGLLILILAVGGIIFIELDMGRVFIDDSLVQSPVSSLSPTNPGTLQELDVYEGEVVKKGDTVAIVDGQTIPAPVSGTVVMANNQIGSTVSSQNPVAQLINPANTRIAGTIDENKGLSDIALGQVVSFTVDALPGQTFWGYVDEISPAAKTTQATFSISSERPTQQFVVYATFNSSTYPQIKQGMSAKMTIFTNTK